MLVLSANEHQTGQIGQNFSRTLYSYNHRNSCQTTNPRNERQPERYNTESGTGYIGVFRRGCPIKAIKEERLKRPAIAEGRYTALVIGKGAKQRERYLRSESFRRHWALEPEALSPAVQWHWAAAGPWPAADDAVTDID